MDFEKINLKHDKQRDIEQNQEKMKLELPTAERERSNIPHSRELQIIALSRFNDILGKDESASFQDEALLRKKNYPDNPRSTARQGG